MAPRKKTETALQPGVKLAAAAVVVFGGLALALLFRPEPAQSRPGAASGSGREHLLLHSQGGPADSPALPWPGGAGSAGGKPSGPRPTVLRPQTPDGPPPSPGREDPDSPPESTSRWGTSRGMSMEMLLPRHDPPAGPRTHTIVDGDSLPALAERYLGSAERYLELFEANRNVLSSPDVLPIGTRLVIPPVSGAPDGPGDPASTRRGGESRGGGYSG